MLEYARWKYILIVVVLLAALLFALPNVFGSAPALQLAHKDHSPVTAAEATSIADYLRQHGAHPGSAYVDSSGRLMVQFADVPQQLQGRDAADTKCQTTYICALSLVPKAPKFFRALGLK